jgi:hypothetical protein
VGVCAQFQANPKESHLIAVKRIIRYVNDTINHGLWYSRDTNLVLAGYSDVDCAGNANDRKNTSGECFYVGNNLVAWLSKKQSSISLFMVEAEYIAPSSCCTQLLWMKQLLLDYGFTQGTMEVHVTTLMPSTFPRILFSIQGPSILTSSITLFVILLSPR